MSIMAFGAMGFGHSRRVMINPIIADWMGGSYNYSRMLADYAI